MPEPGFTRRSPYERELQPVAIVSVDPISRTAIGVTRTRHNVNINCSYATGETVTIPASGEQWYCERFDNEWRLYGRIPFNDPTLNIIPEEGQVLVGSAFGPLELNGTEVRANGKVFRLNGVYYRDSGVALERSTDKITWEPIITATAGLGGLVQMIAKSLTGFDGTDQTLALLSLENWSEILGVIIENFSTFWNELCQNVFVNGLKRMGFGETDLSKIVDGFQNFIDYLFSVIFCDFDGNLTPQTVLARLRDLLAPIIDNPFVQGLKAIADILGVTIGNLLNDVVAGATSFFELVFDIIFCRWDDVIETLSAAFARVTGQEPGENSWLTVLAQILGLASGEGDDPAPFGPGTIFAAIYGFFNFIGGPDSWLGMAARAISDLLDNLIQAGLSTLEMTGNLLQDALQGIVEFLRVLFELFTCGIDFSEIGAFLDTLAESAVDLGFPGLVLQTIANIFGPLTDPETLVGSVIKALFDFAEAMGVGVVNLFDGAVKGLVEIVGTVFGILTCSLDEERLTSLAGFIADSAGGLVAGIIELLQNVLAPLTQEEILGFPNPIAIFLNGLKTFAEEQLGLTVTNLFDGAIQGAVGLVQLVIGVITCQPDSLELLFGMVNDAVAGTDGPLGILKIFRSLFEDLMANPLVQAIEDFTTNVLGSTGTLLEKIVSGTGDLMNLLLKIVKEILPFDQVWTALLPFIDWDAVDAVTLPSLGNLLNGLDLWTIIFKPLDDLIGGVFTTFLTNLNSFFGGMGLLDGTFDPVAAIDFFLKNILGLLDNAGKIIGNLLPAITAETITDLVDWFRDTFLGGAADLFTWFQEELLGGAADLLVWLKEQVRNWLGIPTNDNLLTWILGILDDLFGGALNGFANLVLNVLSFFGIDFLGENPDFSGIGWLINFGQRVLDHAVTDFNALIEAFKEFLGRIPVIGQLLGLAGGDNTPDGRPITSLDDLVVWFQNKVLTVDKPIPATNLFGDIPKALLSTIGVAQVDDSMPNQVNLNTFPGPEVMQQGGRWSWDGSQSTESGSGAAKVTCNAAQSYMFSNKIPVSAGQKLGLQAYVKWSGLSHTDFFNSPISIGVRTYTNGVVQQQFFPIASVPTLGLSANSGWILVENVLPWVVPTSFTNDEGVLVSTAVDEVRMAIGVNQSALAGTVWFDDIALRKTNKMDQNLITDIVGALTSVREGLTGVNPGTITPAAATSTNMYSSASAFRSAFNDEASRGDTLRLNLFGNPGTVGTQVQANAVPNLSASKINAGTFLDARIPSLNADKIGSGQFGNARIADGAISTLKIGLGQVINDRIADGTIRGGKIGIRTITGGANGNIGTVSAGGSLTSENLQEVDASKLQSGTPGAPVLANIGANVNPTANAGVILSRNTNEAYSISAAQQTFPTGFYTNATSSSLYTVSTSGGKFTGIVQPTVAGWYLVEMGFKIGGGGIGWAVAPVLYRNGSPYRVGNDANTDGDILPGGASPTRFTQSSWMVYLNGSTDTVQGGLDATGWSVNLVAADSAGKFTYFSIVLLNKTYA